MDEAFGHWLAGFADGEGCFTIGPTHGGTKKRRTWTAEFKIQLRADDVGILREIQRETGLGIVFFGSQARDRVDSNPRAVWSVYKKREVALIVELFNRYPLRAKKKQGIS